VIVESVEVLKEEDKRFEWRLAILFYFYSQLLTDNGPKSKKEPT